MSVTLYEPALAALLDTQEGPVGRYVQRLAAAVVARGAAEQFDGYFGTRSLAGRVDQDVDFSMEGSTATIGYQGRREQVPASRSSSRPREAQLAPPIRTRAGAVRQMPGTSPEDLFALAQDYLRGVRGRAGHDSHIRSGARGCSGAKLCRARSACAGLLPATDR